MATAATDAEVGVAQTASQLAPSQISAPQTTNLEDAFWACDYVATTRGTSATPTEFCAAIYDEIKAIKFDGDFDMLLAWWQANKGVAHPKLAGALVVRPASAPHATASINAAGSKHTPKWADVGGAQ
jgi:hypothetical protein